MEDKISKVYRILKWVMLGIFLLCVLLLFLPQSIIPFDMTNFRSYGGLWIFLVLIVSFSAFIYFLIYPALEKFKDNFRKSLLEETDKKFEDVHKQIDELSKKMDNSNGSK